MRATRLGPVVVGLLATGALVAGCGGGSTGAPAPSVPASVTASPAPSDCQTGGSLGGRQATFAVQVLLDVDYRNQLAAPTVLQPLLTDTYYQTVSKSLKDNQQTIQSTKLEETVVLGTTGYVSGPCTTPVYRIPATRTSKNKTTAAKTQRLVVSATMTWDGTGYLVANLTTA